jgi:hypothetical protein
MKAGHQTSRGALAQPNHHRIEESIMAKLLSQFTIARTSDGDYLLTIDTDDGETLEFEASYEQLDLMVEGIEEQLDSDEEDALGVDDDGAQDKDEADD